MKDKRISKERYIYFKGTDYYILIDYSYYDKVWTEDLQAFEIGEFYTIKPTISGLVQGLLDITPVLLGIFQPLSGIIQNQNISLFVLNGKLHKEDGPALVRPNGYVGWYLNGIKYTQEQFWETQRNTIHAPLIMASILGNKNE